MISVILHSFIIIIKITERKNNDILKIALQREDILPNVAVCYLIFLFLVKFCINYPSWINIYNGITSIWLFLCVCDCKCMFKLLAACF